MDENNTEEQPVVAPEVTKASEVKTERKFTDLSVQDIKGLNDDDAKKYATSQGWIAPENFRGDRTRLKTAKDYLEDTYNEMPILRSNFKKVTNKLEDMQKQMEQNSKQTQALLEKQTAKHKKELESRIKQSEAKKEKAKTEYDISSVEEETNNIASFNNELKEVEQQEQQIAQQVKQDADAKLQEYRVWTDSQEARELMVEDPVRFEAFETRVGKIYTKDKNLPVSEIVKQAKEWAYPKKKKAPNLQGANASNKTSQSVKLDQDSIDTIKRYADNACALKQRQGMSESDIKKFRTDYIKDFEKKLTEGDA